MLVKLIRNPSNRSTVFGGNVFQGPATRTLQRQTQFHPRDRRALSVPVRGLPPTLTNDDFIYPGEWTKVKFAQWITGVQERFKKGQLVSLAIITPIAHIAPFYFTVEDIHEIQKFCPWDKVANEPACILVRTKAGDLYRKSPNVLRPLTEAELQLVNLQDTKPAGTA